MAPPVHKSCGKCKLPIKDRAILSCVCCKLHFHIDCKGYEKRYYLLSAERKAQWQCDVCLRKNYKVKIASAQSSASKQVLVKSLVGTTESPAKSTTLQEMPAVDANESDEVIDPFQNVTLRRKSKRAASVSSDDTYLSQGDTALEITSALKEYIAVQMSSFTQQLFTKIDTLASSLQTFNSRCNNIEQRITSIEKRLDEKVDEKFNDLADTVDRLKCELNEREQELLLNEVEFSGIPEASGENPVHIVTIIGNKLGVKIVENDVVCAVRVGARREPTTTAAAAEARAPARPAPRASAPYTGPAAAAATGDETGPRLLVVRLLRRTQRDELLRAARVRRGADTTGLGLPGPTRRFYVNERLTRANRQLFRRAREEVRRLEWKFAWTRDGAILVRREHGESVKRIRMEDDFLRVFGAQPVGGL